MKAFLRSNQGYWDSQPLPLVRLSVKISRTKHHPDDGSGAHHWEWDGTHQTSLRLVIKKKKVPQIPMLICPVETTGSMWKWVGVGMVIRSVISVIGAGWTKRRKSFTLIIASSFPRLLQNRFQLQVWFPFLEDQAEFMHRKCELDFGYGGKNFFFLIPYSLNMEIKLVLETNH